MFTYFQSGKNTENINFKPKEKEFRNYIVKKEFNTGKNHANLQIYVKYFKNRPLVYPRQV